MAKAPELSPIIQDYMWIPVTNALFVVTVTTSWHEAFDTVVMRTQAVHTCLIQQLYEGFALTHGRPLPSSTRVLIGLQNTVMSQR